MGHVTGNHRSPVEDEGNGKGERVLPQSQKRKVRLASAGAGVGRKLFAHRSPSGPRSSPHTGTVSHTQVVHTPGSGNIGSRIQGGGT